METETLIYLGVGVIVLVFLIVLLLSTPGSDKKGKQEAGNGNAKNSNGKNANGASKKKPEDDEDKKDNQQLFAKKEVPRLDIKKFMEFDKISDDMIIQKNNSVYTMVVQCKGINYDLMSEIEQTAIEEGFITFLNTLRFPIQIYVQARSVDLRGSMQIFNEKISEIEDNCHVYENNLTKLIQGGVTAQRDIYEAQMDYQKYANMLSYAKDITNYVSRMSSNKQMLQRKFYIVLSYNKSEITNLDRFSPQEVIQLCYTELYTRAQSLIGALQACSVSGKVLDSNMLAELLFISYNRDDEKIIDIKQALSSGFYRLFSVTKDVNLKREEVLAKEYQKESSKRIQDMIKFGVSKGSIPKAGEEAASQDPNVEKLVMKYIAEADLDLDLKDALSKLIIKKHMDREEKVKEAARISQQSAMNRLKMETQQPVQPVQRQVVQPQGATQRLVRQVPQSQAAQVQRPVAPQTAQVARPVQPQGQAQVARPVQPQGQAQVVRPVQPQGQAQVVRPVQPQGQAQVVRPVQPQGQAQVARPVQPQGQAQVARPAQPQGQAQVVRPVQPQGQAQVVRPVQPQGQTAQVQRPAAQQPQQAVQAQVPQNPNVARPLDQVIKQNGMQSKI